MARLLAFVVALVAATALVLVALRSSAGGAVEPRLGEADAAGEELAENLVAVEPGDAKRVSGAPPESAPDPPPGSASDAGELEDPAPVADLTATQGLELRVVDPEGAPVMDAQVSIRGHRTEAMPRTYFSYRGELPTGRTDFDGRVRLEHFTWVNQDGRVSEVDLYVEHESFVKFRNSLFPVEGDTVHEVPLVRGGLVALTAWIADPSRTAQDLTIDVDWEAGVDDGDWQVEPGGRRTTDRFTPGLHQLRVTHVADDGAVHFSDLVDLTVEPGGYEEIFVELRPAVRFEGMVDPRVPRPIVDGIALIGVHRLGGSRRPSLGVRRRAEIAADGRFAFDGLPAGEGQLVVLCSGWVSRKSRLPTSPASEGWPPVEIPGDGTFTVPMEPTGSVEVLVLGPDRRPLADATVRVSPNYSFWGLGSSIVPGRDWRVTTGPDGVAIIDDVPPADRLFVSAKHDDHQLRERERIESPVIEVRSGERAKRTFELE